MAIEFIRFLDGNGEPAGFQAREMGDRTRRILTLLGDAMISGLVVVRHPLAEGEHDLTPYLSAESLGWCAATVSAAGTAVLRLGLKGKEVISRVELFEHRMTGQQVVSSGPAQLRIPEESKMTDLFNATDEGVPDQSFAVVRHVESTAMYAATFDELPLQELPPLP